MSDLDRLKVKRAAKRDTINALCDEVKALTASEEPVCETKLVGLEANIKKHAKSIELLDNKIEDKIKLSDLAAELADADKFKNHIGEAIAALSVLEKKHNSSFVEVPVSSSPVIVQTTPSAAVPTFSGNVLKWSSFIDLFNGAFGSQEHLSGSQKLMFLKQHLSGPCGCRSANNRCRVEGFDLKSRPDADTFSYRKSGKSARPVNIYLLDKV